MARGVSAANKECESCGLHARRALASLTAMNIVTAPMLDSLRALLGGDRVLTSQEDLIPYSFDGTAALKQRPGVVVFPLTTQEVAACVKLARDRSIPVVTRGSGTGLSGLIVGDGAD